jgi:hypothetical protein
MIDMEQELLDEIQNIKGFNTYRIWCVGTKKYGGSFYGKRYTRRGDAINCVSRSSLGLRLYILVKVNSITGTTYEWI